MPEELVCLTPSTMARDGAVKASELRMKTKVELEKQAVRGNSSTLSIRILTYGVAIARLLSFAGACR